MPCDTGTCDITKVDEFSEVLNDIYLLIQKVNPSDVVIGGDLNTEFNRRSAHPMSLQSFCDNEKLYNARDQSIADVDYTYCNYATGVTSINDHFLLTECTFRSILGVKVSNRGANLSDHDPVLIELRIPHQKLKLKKQQTHRKVQWYNATEVDYNDRREEIDRNLWNIQDVDCINCRNVMCNEHGAHYFCYNR